ncbi:hypothetical protein FD755_023541, partial [Muntiacus reevesi]
NLPIYKYIEPFNLLGLTGLLIYKKYIFHSICGSVMSTSDTGFRLDSLHTILQQEVLLQEDVELIELLDPSILSAGQPQQQENGHLPTLCSLATPNIWDVSVVFAFISLLVMLPTWWIVSSWLVWGVILFVYLIIRSLRLWRTAKLQITLKKYNVYLEDIVTNSRGFTNLVRKALRLIQETEVISRGFTLVSAACPLNKAGQHPSQHLSGLRKTVYRTVRANFQAARLATLYMLKKYPFLDNVTNYICVVPFKELGLGLSEEQISEEEAHNLTDGFSLPALKNSHQWSKCQLLHFSNEYQSLQKNVPFTPSTLAYRFISESNQRHIQSMFIILLQQQILETKEKFSDTRFGMIYCIHLLNFKECYKTVCIVRFQQYFLKVNPNLHVFPIPIPPPTSLPTRLLRVLP